MRGLREYTIPPRVLEQQFVIMRHQHHLEMLQRLEAKGIVIAGSRFPMKEVMVRIVFLSDDVKDFERGEKVSKEYHCKDCNGTDKYLFQLRRAEETPEWTLRSGKAPPDTEMLIGGRDLPRGEIRIERKD